jgi:hypothetical protein
MLSKQTLICTYNGYHREMCAHTLGIGIGGVEKVLSYQFAGDSSRPPKSDDDRWRCMDVANIQNLRVIDGPWHTSDNHSREQTCVKVIDLEVYS